jgi:hypothetical protein
MYFPEAFQRWHSYPPPYYSAGAWTYTHPWLWYDGNPHGGRSYTTWPTKITTRMNQPSPVTIRVWGNYNSTTRSGTICAQFRNDSIAIINANVLFVITEDSIYRPTPNTDLWHNHVARDFIPGPVGVPISISVGDSVTYSQTFAINDSWNVNHCEIVAIIQDTVLSHDSIKQILQGATKKVMTLSLEEEQSEMSNFTSAVDVAPNPCVNKTYIAFTLPVNEKYTITIFNQAGCVVKTENGIASGHKETIRCKLCNTGIYFYQFRSDNLNTTGKIVVR